MPYSTDRSCHSCSTGDMMSRYYMSAYGIFADGKTRRLVGDECGYGSIIEARSAGYRILRPHVDSRAKKGRMHGIFLYESKKEAESGGFPVGELSVDRPYQNAGFISYTPVRYDGVECVHRLNRDGTLDPEILHTYYPRY